MKSMIGAILVASASGLIFGSLVNHPYFSPEGLMIGFVIGLLASLGLTLVLQTKPR